MSLHETPANEISASKDAFAKKITFLAEYRISDQNNIAMSF